MPTMAELAAAIVARQELPPDKGDMGLTGPEGKAGLDGSNGRNGDPGPKGDKGDRGPIGANGADGRNGVDGKDGVDGDPGLVWRGPWVRNLQYWADDAVEQDGSSYVCTVATRSKPPSGAWDLLAKRGATGPPGMSRGGGGGGGGSALTVKDEGTSLDTAVSSFDFVGTGVTATNVGHAVTVSVTGGGGGSGVYAAEGTPIGTDAFQRVTVTGSPAGGSFKLTPDGFAETVAIAWNATQADYLAALETVLGIGNVFVLDQLMDNGSMVVHFRETLGRQEVAAIVVSDNSLTGGASPDVAIEQLQPGAVPIVIPADVFVFYDRELHVIWVLDGIDWAPVSGLASYSSSGIGHSYINAAEGGPEMYELDEVGAFAGEARFGEPTRIDIGGDTGAAGDVLTAQGVDGVALWGSVIAALIAGGGQAAFVPDPATPEQIRDALVAVGIMAAV